MFADLHNHPLARAFNKYRNDSAIENDPNKFHGWNVPGSDLKALEKGGRAWSYSQCDLVRSTHSRTRLLFASLYPIEKGFFIGKSKGTNKEKVDLNVMADLFDFSNDDKLGPELEKAIKDVNLQLVLRGFIQSKKMRLNPERIKFLQGRLNEKYDYFEEVKKEYDFYKRRNGIETIITDFDLTRKKKLLKASGRYQIARSGNEAAVIINSDPDDVALVLTIEGMHALGMGNPDPKDNPTPEQLKERIRIIKGEGPGAWEHPVFFVTFAHHFSNDLCGHAHSIPKPGTMFMDQSRDINTGVKDIGFVAMRELLGLNDSLNDTGSRRVLIDVKHMSAHARKDYYDKIVKPYNQVNPDRKIPIIASHVGYSGINRLQELIERADQEHNNSGDRFLAWNINICDEDIIEIHKSEGLIGLSFDQRILGIDRTILGGTINIPIKKLNDISTFSLMLEHIVRVPFQKQMNDPHSIWRMISIGTDFEGYIDPVNIYSSVLDFSGTGPSRNKSLGFEKDLFNELSSWRKDTRAALIGLNNVEELVKGICFRNAYDFVKKHF